MSTGTTHSSDKKVVLCVPRWCGLNDSLVQIWFAHQFATSHGRQLLIDTRISGLWDDLDNYLDLQVATKVGQVPITLRVSDSDIHHLNKKRAYPRLFKNRLDFMHREIFLRASLEEKRSKLGRSIACVSHSLFDRTPSDFHWGVSRRAHFLIFLMLSRRRNAANRLSASANQPVIVHHKSGGGRESLQTLKLFSFAPTLKREVGKALNFCGTDFDAIHIRNTDMKTHYVEFLSNSRKRLAGRRVLVCSDDAEVINAAREQLFESDVFTVTKTEATNGSPLHKLGSDRTPEQRRLLNFNMLIDLICLSQGRELLLARSTNGQLSGFSALAQSLHGRSDIVQQLIKE